ncbi:hypothetical protein L1987_54253 [Smallanthus sonchifolius]|uniref:Uncharacterized protein n=1 Tax=Smallanthus sonchifolius TaxID=185202 RepID=A0ACB9E691_9ASTR|nr:hypothetical protein L1987_54253 [Smallanthus sonchifolius]
MAGALHNVVTVRHHIPDLFCISDINEVFSAALGWSKTCSVVQRVAGRAGVRPSSTLQLRMNSIKSMIATIQAIRTSWVHLSLSLDYPDKDVLIQTSHHRHSNRIGVPTTSYSLRQRSNGAAEPHRLLVSRRLQPHACLKV